MSRRIGFGDTVLLYLDRKRRWLVKVSEGKQFHTHRGFIELEKVVGKSFGDSVTTSSGDKLYVLKPTLVDFLNFFERPTQVLYPKDLGLLLLKLDLEPGKRVIEAGTGSGVATAAIANAVKPGGHVYSYDVNLDFLNKARQNLSRLNLLKYVTLKHSDARDGFDEIDVDAVFLDLGDPWNVVSKAYLKLKGGGTLASFSPTMNQVEKTVSMMKKEGFIDIETCELLLRHMQVEEGRFRPETRMVAHTGYLTFARKANREDSEI
ncbi:MAG: tRNA (adenine-N1)-methyltransferase [Candidatus Bathyarchaeia archaeon]